MSAFGGPRGASVKPPEKGIFPLDHFGECKEFADLYQQCVSDNRGDVKPCLHLTQSYLLCRQRKNLMATQDLTSLGLKSEPTGS